MTNKEIANKLNELGKIMELHDENAFKIRSYSNAYLSIRKLDTPLSEMEGFEMASVRGIGKAIEGKIKELLEKGEMDTLNRYLEMTPKGIQEMLKIKGFGPKKIKVIWKDMGVETIGELLYACNENRLIELKGFGKKTQEDLKGKLMYFLQSKDQFHYASVEKEAFELVEKIEERLYENFVSLTGAIRRKAIILDKIELLITDEDNIDEILDEEILSLESKDDDIVYARTPNNIPVTIYLCDPEEFGSKLFRYTAEEKFLQSFIKTNEGIDFKELETEQEVFDLAKMPFIEPELREGDTFLHLAQKDKLPVLIEDKDIKGILHNHSTYSDGMYSLKKMAEYVRDSGFEYFGISDHSKSAFYANGLQPDRVLAQMAEIDKLNKAMAPFKIFKGIESDILNDGSLDYEEDILKKFDFIVASVHTNLKMDEEKATKRLITAVENPYTTILGHPTGRLLLARTAYPLDHKKVIDACAANNVAIELNANPHRLDMDWTWIPYAIEKGVMIAIDPDAHSQEGIHDIHWGVCAARKGGLTVEHSLCSLGLSEFEKYLEK